MIFPFVCAVAAWGNTFFSGTAKREAPGPFAAAPIVQGGWANGDPSDTLLFLRGNQIGALFYEGLDADQGSLVVWLTPEWDGNDGKRHDFFNNQFGNPGRVSLRAQSNNLIFRVGATIGTDEVSVDISTWVAGQTHLVVGRWDNDNALDGTNTISLSIDDVHAFSTQLFPPTAINNQNFIGSERSGLYPANAIIEGLTIYRRSLFDGTFGIDVGNGDEINQIYNAGAGEDPTRITGSWDVVFCLPTSSMTGALSTGTGEAWSHPHASNFLYTNTTNTGGFMLNGTYTVDGWSDEGTPTAVSALATAEKIFAGGYKFTTDAANEGIYQDLTVSAGDDWVVRALAHSDGTCRPALALFDQTNLMPIGGLQGTTTSTRTAPDVFVLTGEAPAGMTTLRVKLINASASGTCYWHQVEVLNNLLTNPSLETGSGDPWIPTGWSTDDPTLGDSTQELTTVHSSSSSIKIVAASEAGFNNIMQTHSGVVEDDFYSYGGFFYWVTGDAPELYITNARLVRQDRLDTKVNRSATVTGAWEHVTGVGRRDDDSTNSLNDLVKWGSNWMDVADHFIDDAYMVHLDNISLTVTAASEANSTENTVEIRVDGGDTYLGANAAGLGTASGTLTFDWRPRHDAAQAVAFTETTSDDAYIVSLFGDVDDYINVYRDSPNTILMAYSMAGTTASGTWDATGAIVADTQYAVEVAYTGGGAMTLKVAGTTRVTLSAIPAAFGEAPDFVRNGSDRLGSHQGDATFANTPTAVDSHPLKRRGWTGR